MAQSKPDDVEMDQQMTAAHVEGAECGFHGDTFFDVKFPDKSVPRKVFNTAHSFGYSVLYTGVESQMFVIRFKHD